MAYFGKVQGNVKGGCDVTLGRLTCITGVNGAGKSRIVNTLELAASAEASDIVGRERVKKGLDLLALAPEDSPLKAQATLSDGRSCSLVIERGGKEGTGKQPQHTPLYGVKVVYPIRDALSALRGEVKKAQDFVLAAAHLPLTPETVKKALDPELHELFDTFFATYEDNDSTLNRLKTMREDATKIARTAKAGAKKAEEIVDSLASDLPLENPSEERIEEAKQAVGKAHIAYNEAIKVPEVVDVDALKAEAVAWIQKHEADKRAYDEMKAVADQPANLVAAAQIKLVPMLEIYAQNDGAHCVLCQQGKVHGASSRLADIEAKVQAEHGRQRAFSMLPTLSARMEQSKARAVSAIQAFKAHESTVQPGTEDRQNRITEAYTALKKAEDTFSELNRARTMWTTIEEARRRVKESTKEAEKATKLADACAKFLRALTKKAKDSFVANVQQYLPESDQFDLVLSQGKREVCLFGFRRNGVLHTALSGAEWARLTIALGAACMTGGDDVVAVLTPEERAFDADTLASVMGALSEAPGQVILTSPVAPSTVPGGWTHIRV